MEYNLEELVDYFPNPLRESKIFTSCKDLVKLWKQKGTVVELPSKLRS
jgi:hypothetical protein